MILIKGKGSGLAVVPKLKYEHVHLTSFSKMKVDLAAQELSESVRKALCLAVGTKAEETDRFVHIFDKFFDIKCEKF
uniref:Transposable element P transposase-like GTP-binding insertion domain-containing protein n=1 Tax=Amphimedon queenslandica TaxID=400682 RepID=A0A1X7TY74_AMPQE